MKKLYFTVLTVLLISCSSDDNNTNTTPPGDNPNDNKYTTTQVNSGTAMTLRKMKFFNASNGFIVGGNASLPNHEALMIKTTDGGETWSKAFEDTGYFITSIEKVSEMRSIAVTNNGVIIVSLDNWATWTKDNTYKDQFFMADVKFLDADFGIIAGSKSNGGGVVLVTENGGQTWKKIESNTIGMLKEIHVTIDGIFITGGSFDNGILLKSYDSGQTWATSAVTDKVLLTDICLQGNNGFALGNNGITNAALEKGELYKTTDGGNNWTIVNTGFNNKLIKMDQSANNICIAGSNKADDLTNPEFALLSVDGGTSWLRLNHNYMAGGWEDVCFVSEKKAFLIGYNGAIMKLEIK